MKHLLYSDANNTFAAFTGATIAKALAPAAAWEDQACCCCTWGRAWGLLPGGLCQWEAGAVLLREQRDEELQPCRALSPTFLFQLCSLPSPFHLPNQEPSGSCHLLVGPRNRLSLQSSEDLNGSVCTEIEEVCLLSVHINVDWNLLVSISITYSCPATYTTLRLGFTIQSNPLSQHC